MKRFHIRDNGDPGLCTAQVGHCPYGSNAPHFNSEVEARSYYETSQQSFFPKKMAQAKPLRTNSDKLLAKAQAFASVDDGSSYGKIPTLMRAINAKPELWTKISETLDDRPIWSTEAMVGNLSLAEAKELRGLLDREKALKANLEKSEDYKKIISHVLTARAKRATNDFNAQKEQLTLKTGLAFRDSIGQDRDSLPYVEGSAYATGVPLVSRVYSDGTITHTTVDGSKSTDFESSMDMKYPYRDPRVQKALAFEKSRKEIVGLYQVHQASIARQRRANNYKTTGDTQAAPARVR